MIGSGKEYLQVFINAALINAFAAVLKDKFASCQFLQVRISVLSSQESVFILPLKKLV